MKIYVAVSISLIPPTVELFTKKEDANAFAFRFKMASGHTLLIAERETRETLSETEMKT